MTGELTGRYQQCRSCRKPLPVNAERLRVDCCSYGCHLLFHGEQPRDTVAALLARLAEARRDAAAEAASSGGAS